MDVIRSEAEAYDVLVFSESRLNHDTNSSNIQIEHFMSPFRSDRQGRFCGEVSVYVRNTLSCKRRSDLDLHSAVSVWVQIQVKFQKGTDWWVL